MSRKSAIIAGIVLSGAGGCTSVAPDAGFDEVARITAQRTARQVRWNHSAAPDAATGQLVRTLLQGDLTADRAIQVALLNNPTLQATFDDLGIAQADVVQAGLLSNPVFFGQVRFPQRTPLELDLTQNVLDLLLLPLRRRVSEARFQETRLRISDEVLKLAAQTRSAFYRVQAAEQVLEMRSAIVAAADASAQLATRLRAAGNKTVLESAQQQAQAQRARLDLAQAEADALEQREVLSEFMGLWGPAIDWKVAGRLPDLPDTEISLPGLESLAVAQRLDLAAARQEIEVLALALKLEPVSAALPQVNVSGHFEREPEGTGTAGPGLDIPLPIFNQGQGVAPAAAARLRRSQNRYTALAIGIRTEVRRCRNRMLAARRRAAYYAGVVLPLQAQIIAQAQLQYNAMQIGPFQLLQARQDQIDASRQHVEALRDYWIARSDLELAVGGRFAAAPPADGTPPASSMPGPTSLGGHR